MGERLGRLLAHRASAAEDDRLPAGPRRVLLAAIGLGCGLGPAFYGYFDLVVWGTIALAFVGLLVALVLAGRALPLGIAGLSVLALLAFGAWCLVSMGWAESGDRALVEGVRWLSYGTFLLVCVLLLEGTLDAAVFLAAATAGVLGIAASDLIGLLGGDRSLFSGTRLLEPLGYVNGMGGFFLLGFWPLVSVAERVRQPLLAGVAAGGATVLACLVVLTDARGALFAFAVSAVLLMAVLPGRPRRGWVIAFVLAGVALAWGSLTDVTSALPSPIARPGAATIERGAEWTLAVAVGVAVAWALASWLLDAAGGTGDSRRARGRLSGALLGALAVVCVVVAATAVSDPIGRVSDQYRSFTALEPTVNGASRFTSGGGNRYDYWRIAWHQFTDHPLAGIGAGNFDRTYFLERRTDEDVRQAHSIELQTLGETGLVGALLLGCFFVAVGVGAWRSRAWGRSGPQGAGLAVAALGSFVVWLAQTSVDWLHLIPSLTGFALGAAAIMLRAPTAARSSRTTALRLGWVGVAAVLALAAVAIVFVGRPVLAERLRSGGQAQLASEPAAALRAAEESLSLNPDSLQGYYLKAAALARLGAYVPARTALHEAIGREPHNYVSWALLGDLLTRRGEIDAALGAYATASRLNPRDPALRLMGSRRGLVERLHRDPGAANAVAEAAG